jgi:hypothetical protein
LQHRLEAFGLVEDIDNDEASFPLELGPGDRGGGGRALRGWTIGSSEHGLDFEVCLEQEDAGHFIVSGEGGNDGRAQVILGNQVVGFSFQGVFDEVDAL